MDREICIVVVFWLICAVIAGCFFISDTYKIQGKITLADVFLLLVVDILAPIVVLGLIFTLIEITLRNSENVIVYQKKTKIMHHKDDYECQ
jgi:hypothetical protein